MMENEVSEDATGYKKLENSYAEKTALDDEAPRAFVFPSPSPRLSAPSERIGFKKTVEAT